VTAKHNEERAIRRSRPSARFWRKKKPVCPDFPRLATSPVANLSDSDRPAWLKRYLEKPVSPDYPRRATSPMATWVIRTDRLSFWRPSTAWAARSRC